MAKTFLNGRVSLWEGDCLDVLQGFEADSFDACVTDPPYHLTSIVKRFGNPNSAEAQFGSDGAYRRASAGFMGKAWDGGDIAFRSETWASVLRVLKPGAHLVAFAAPKNSHRLACAIEDGGFEIRDTICWLFGSGFPKSHDVSKGIDRQAGAERDTIRREKNWGARPEIGPNGHVGEWAITAPSTDAAREWQGWGTALKPAYEPIVLARKPFKGTVADNVLRHGTGAINVDGCRVTANAADITRAAVPQPMLRPDGVDSGHALGSGEGRNGEVFNMARGRWPANVITDGSDEVVEAFPETQSGSWNGELTGRGSEHSGNWGKKDRPYFYQGDSGSAARFFYTAKAGSDERIGSKHPTVKPLDLMQYLVRLITPPKGAILDPFAGTGTTAEAAWREGFSAVLIEREAEYIADIERRMALALAGPDERARESIKARGLTADAGPLFGGSQKTGGGQTDLRGLRGRTIGPIGLKW